MIFLLALIGAAGGAVFESMRNRDISPMRSTERMLVFVFLFFFITGVLVSITSMYQAIAANL